MPHDYAPWVATLEGVQRVGTHIFVRMGAIDEKKIDTSVVRRIVEVSAVAEQEMNLLVDIHAFPNVALSFLMHSGMQTVDRRSRQGGFSARRQIQRVNRALVTV